MYLLNKLNQFLRQKMPININAIDVNKFKLSVETFGV